MKTVFWDVDTQNDFMNEDGRLYVTGAELIKPNLKLLTEYARENFIPVAGSVDRHFGTPEYKHREQELQRNGGLFSDHCMDGTPGFEKIPETTLRAYRVPHNLDNSVNEFELTEAFQQAQVKDLIFAKKFANNPQALQTQRKYKTGIYFEKQSYDVFTNPAAEKFLKLAGITEAVVYGVAIDYCVKAAVLGMQEREIQTYVVEDAVKGVTDESAKLALEQMAQAGAEFLTTKQVLEGCVK